MKSDWQYSRIIPVALVMGIIFFLSHQKGSSLPLPSIPYIDKLAHFLIYSLLAGTALFAFPSSMRLGHPERKVVAVMIFCLIYGITDELHQAFIPERDASIWDLFADFLGGAATVLFWYRQQWLKPKPYYYETKLSGAIKPDNASGLQ